MKQVYTTAQAARVLGVAPRTVRMWFDSGKLPGGYVENGDRLIPREELARFMVAYGVATREDEACQMIDARVGSH